MPNLREVYLGHLYGGTVIELPNSGFGQVHPSVGADLR